MTLETLADVSDWDRSDFGLDGTDGIEVVEESLEELTDSGGADVDSVLAAADR